MALGLALSPSALGQYINDGHFDNLPVGTPPDNAAPAGAWGFIATYPSNTFEVVPTEFTIVDSGAFDPSTPGHSLRLHRPRPSLLPQCVNVLPGVILEQPGRIVRIDLRVWNTENTSDGGAFYVSADMGGGGGSFFSDRGPQIRWTNTGSMAMYPGSGIPVSLVSACPAGVWQRVRLEVRLDDDRYDAYWAAGSQPLKLVGSDLEFRSGFLDKIDRVTFTPFQFQVHSPVYFDDVTISVIDYCYPDCNGDRALTVADFGCFQTKFVAVDPYADCNKSASYTVADFACFQAAFVAGCP